MSTTVIAFQIEKGVPMPFTSTRRRSAFMTAVEAAIPQMEIGDSFSYSDTTKSASFSSGVRDAAKRAGIKVTLRKTGDGEYRVWRTE